MTNTTIDFEFQEIVENFSRANLVFFGIAWSQVPGAIIFHLKMVTTVKLCKKGQILLICIINERALDFLTNWLVDVLTGQQEKNWLLNRTFISGEIRFGI